MKAPIVKRIVVKRFRSIVAADIPLDNPLFVVGRNGSGKSNFADIFGFIADAMRSPLDVVFDNRAGISSVRHRASGKGYPANFGIKVEIGDDGGTIRNGFFSFEIRAKPDYGFEVLREQCYLKLYDGNAYWYDRTDSFKSSPNVQNLHPPVSPQSLCLPLVAGDERFAPIYRILSGFRVYSIVPKAMKEMQDADAGTALKSDGSNAASVLKTLTKNNKENYERLLEYLSNAVPDTESVNAVSRGNKMTFEFKQNVGNNHQLKFESFNMSDGTVRILGILLAFFQTPKPSLVVIEEPEATIHPGALGAVMDAIMEAAEGTQVIVTSHSPELLDARWIGENNIRCVTWDHGATHILPPSDSVKESLRTHLLGAGELLRTDSLQPGKNRLFTEDFRPAQLPLFDVLS